MSDKLKPCPYCNGKANLWIEDACFYYVCTDCNMRGPDIFVEKANAAEQVAEAWNTLPRPLRWTTETPTEPDFYWHRDDGVLSIAYIYESAGTLFCHFAGEEGATLLDLVTGEWAGPIPEPHQN